MSITLNINVSIFQGLDMIKHILFLLVLMLPIKAADKPEPLDLEKLITSLVNCGNFAGAASEKTADQILAENQHKPEFMSCSKWLQMECPNFSEGKVASHPFFPLLKEAMSLADFEVDALEGFVHTYMETDMPKEQGQILIKLRKTSIAAKNFVRGLINLLEGEESIQQFIEKYCEGRFKQIVLYQAELKGQTDTVIDLSKGTIQSLALTSDPIYDSIKNSFLRSYNIKNKIIRELLYALKDHQEKPLANRLSPMLVGLLRLSTSLHPFLNKENDEWIDYDCSLAAKEDLNFLGNAKEMGVNLRELFKNREITDFKIPRSSYTKINNISFPKFLGEGSMEVDPSLFEKSKSSRKTTHTKTTKTKVKKPSPSVVKEADRLPTETENMVGSTCENLSFGSNLQEESSLVKELEKPLLETHTLPIIPALASYSNLKKEDAAPIQLSLTPTLTQKKKTDENSSSSGEQPKEKVRNRHVETIYDIFSPKGYTSLNSDRIIKAWTHILQGRGYHKENTGRSHQPLYATLLDGSKVVFGLFISSSYGPRYVNYIREAFEKIGFGKKWLEERGYDLG